MTKLDYIYVRQSTAGQVRHHQESTELQYHLVARAVTLGWPRERVAVIDDRPQVGEVAVATRASAEVIGPINVVTPKEFTMLQLAEDRGASGRLKQSHSV